MDHIRVLEGKGTSVVTQGCFGTLADLAGLRPITAEGISLGLVTQESTEDYEAPPPDTICPLQALHVCSDSIPTLENLAVALVQKHYLTPGTSVWTVFVAPGTQGNLVPEHRDHTNDQPAARLRTDTVVQAPKGHCTGETSVKI
jgi:hypothetical protein